ncbi:M56 family metallopeptidase [Flavobacterium akiainvivens]|uniref:M56 family metallopeptidase n=1 Tax=Flavobacterium akiainvivens TaxID=1202724 RepID=UPI0006C8620E|nr:M56 family metallopeptidase [Flavobacterium akiainvivens]SFQ11673.1 Signal transducer regulating beta-lactamase production, contains metallopeptidase domain [Flavobacterium akiainvivens]
MIMFLIKSAIALVLFLGIYHLLLQRESMHRFNRFYLLGSVVISLLLPLINIPIYVEAETIAPAVITVSEVLAPVMPTPEESINYWPYILWCIYGLVTLLFIIRFALNVRRFYTVKKNNEKLGYKGATIVLLEEAVPPHTFMATIFTNRKDYENRHTEPELFTHELAHVNQRHTLDILFIELLKTIMWFNPLLYLYKRAIQLNHEFLADAATLSQHHNVTNYQSLLLGKAQPQLQFALASSINFSITKKRFIMMTKTTPKTKASLLKLAALPVLAGLVYTLSTETVAQNTAITQLSAQTPGDQNKDRDEYYSNVRVVIDDKVKNVNFSKMYEELTDAEKDRYMFDVPLRNKKKEPTAKELETYKDKKTYAIWIDGKNVDNSVLNKYKPQDFALYTGSFVHKNARTKTHPQQYQFSLYTHAYYDANFSKFHYPGDTYRMNISKQYKDGVELKSSRTELYYPDGGRRISQMEEGTPQVQDKVYGAQETETNPEYPGGLTAFYKLIADNYKIDGKLTGDLRMVAQFIVEKDGSLSGIKVEKPFTKELGDELIRVFKLSEKWKPGYVKGQAVRTSFVLPVQINEN